LKKKKPSKTTQFDTHHSQAVSESFMCKHSGCEHETCEN